ncbi:MAG TPA: YebC/PmpR family DNA-binding transcriptional regulator [Myxococcota bacterium]|nr:YebC/PmpR family DNA-binding transcriptional regulator [Myxococcota bacterium]HRY95759.1 YebC/PmpR family DNA-binding transcriptional regulator [Myxococcota bacterium]HSA24505.1 YebC/PmpR family DNA-binding transcriptional regulator [Myxococcota bacterium]
MSGHSKWSTIKHKKGAADAKRGRIFTKLIKEITIAARAGGGSPEFNPRLRSAIIDAKASNMPANNIERAIKKGTGELEGVSYEELTFEGYGAGGVAVMVDVITDNRNRTSSEIRKIFSKHAGNMGEVGCVGWMFQTKGSILIEKPAATEERLMELALEIGADDIRDDGDMWNVVTPPSALLAVREALEKAGIAIQSAKVERVPQNTVAVAGKEADQVLRLAEALEDHDDVQNVYANFDIDESSLPAEA